MKTTGGIATCSLMLCLIGAINAASAYSPLDWIDPTDPKIGSFAFELTETVGSDGISKCRLTVTIGDRDFHEGISIRLFPIQDPLGNTDQNITSWRELPYTKTDRTIVCEFVLTKEEAADPDIAFHFAEPVIRIDQSGKIWRPPSITFCFGWVSDFLAGDENSERARRERVNYLKLEHASDAN
ncbi:MAG: hypothetical protein AAGA96_17000 [Verrucomicrobiota bacterium]